MTDSFEKWINGMQEQMYEDWLEDKATEAQEEKALNIRTPLSEEEEDDLEMQQTYREELPESRNREVDTQVYDNRDQPAKRFYAEVIMPPTGRAPIIRPIRSINNNQPIQQPQIRTTVTQPQQQASRPSRFAKVTGFFRTIFRRTR